MKTIIDNGSMIPIYEQIVNQVKKKILNGSLHENEGLPSVRVLAKDLRISALTVKKAYDTLEEEGFCTTIHGKGTFVRAVDASLVKEERLMQIQNQLVNVIQKAKAYDVSKEELKELWNILLEEE